MRVEAEYLVESIRCVALQFRKDYQIHDSVAPKMHDHSEFSLYTSKTEPCSTLHNLLENKKSVACR